MADDIKAGVRLSLKDQYSQGIKGAGTATKDFAGTALGAVDKVNKAFSGLAGTLGTLGVTIGIGAAVKTYIDLDERMVRIGTDLGLAADKTNELKRSLYEVAQDPAIKMGTDSLLEAMETLAGKNFDAGVIEDNLRNIGLVMKATGVSGGEAAAFFIESFKRGMSGDEIMKSLDDISVIGDMLHNQFSLSDFTKSFSELEATNTLLGKSAMNTTELYTAMNILASGRGGPAKALASYKAIINELADPRKQELLWNLGIEVREGGIGNFRDLADILKEIAATDEGSRNFDRLSQEFSTAAMDAIFAYNQFGNLADGLENLGDTTGEIEKKAENNAKALAANLKNLQTAFYSFADERLTKPLEKLTEFLNFLAERPKIATAAMWGLTAAIAAAGAVKFGAGLTTIIANLKGFKGGKIDLAGAAGGGAGIPVHVTNWGGVEGSSLLPGGSQGLPGSTQLLPGASVGKTPDGRPAGTPLNQPRFGITKKQAAVTGGLAAVSAAVFAVPQMMGELNAIKQDETLTSKERGKATGGAVGGAAGSIGGAAAGAIAGAAIGSVVPVVGTALGALAGGLIGYFGGKGGRFIGEKIGEAVAKEDIPKSEGIPKIAADEINAVPRIPQGGGNPVLEGSARLENYIHLYDDRTEVLSRVKHNTTPIEVDTGSAVTVRRNAL